MADQNIAALTFALQAAQQRPPDVLWIRAASAENREHRFLRLIASGKDGRIDLEEIDQLIVEAQADAMEPGRQGPLPA